MLCCVQQLCTMIRIHEQFLNMSVGLGLVFVCLFTFSILCVFFFLFLLRLFMPYGIGQAIISLPCGFFFFLLLFFLTSSQPSQIGCLPYFHTWCGLSANLRYRSETCGTELAENSGPKKSPKIAIWAPSHNFVELYLRS